MEAVTLTILLALAQPIVSPAQLEACELARRANLDDALTWEGRAHEARIHHHACLERLAVRTSTPTPAVVEFRAIDGGPSAPMIILGGVVIFVVGVAAGLGIALAAR